MPADGRNNGGPLAVHRRFALRVRRRLGRALLVESGLLAAAVSGGAVAVLICRSRWVGTSPGRVLAAITALIGAVAAVHVVRRWPTLAAAADAADRHFGWDDLLSSAIQTSGVPGDLTAAVWAAADIRCEESRPARVPVPVRSRTVIGSCMMMVAAGTAIVCVRPSSGPTTAIRAEADAVLTADVDAPPSDARSAASIRPPPPPPRVSASSDDRRWSTSADESSAGSRPGSGKPAANGGAGRGRASSPPPVAASAAETGFGAAGVDSGGSLAAGATSARPESGLSTAGVGRVTGVDSAPVSAPWRATGSVTPVDAAALARSVPVADRPLVRAYFDPTRRP